MAGSRTNSKVSAAAQSARWLPSAAPVDTAAAVGGGSTAAAPTVSWQGPFLLWSFDRNPDSPQRNQHMMCWLQEAKARFRHLFLFWAPCSLFVNIILVFVPDLEEKDQRKTNKVMDNRVYNNSSQRYDEQGDGTSACLLIMDANHLLIEWIAYHYHVLRLRHLIVAVDPRSKTTPTDILKRWAGRMNVQIWHDEKRYINLQNFRQNVEERMKEYHREASNFDLSAHRIRQREFNKECIIAHKMKDRGWTFLTDADEFVYMNPSKRDQQNFPDWENLPSVDKPDSIYTVLQKLSLPNNPSGITEPCVLIARRQFSANEDKQKVKSFLLIRG